VENQTRSGPNFKLWLLFTSIHHKMVALREKELYSYNITTSQLRLLRIIESLGSKAIFSEVAKILERKLDVISRQAAMMEKDGLITRIRDKPKSYRKRFTSAVVGNFRDDHIFAFPWKVLKNCNEVRSRCGFLAEQELKQKLLDVMNCSL